jgi:hypothetical protein
VAEDLEGRRPNIVVEGGDVLDGDTVLGGSMDGGELKW